MEPSKRFHVFEGTKEGKPVLITADPDYELHIPNKLFSFLLSIVILFEKDERGFPVPEDLKKIVSFENKLENDPLFEKNFFLAGTVTLNGKKELYYYCDEKVLRKEMLDQFIAESGLRISYMFSKDPSFQEAKYHLGI